MILINVIVNIKIMKIIHEIKIIIIILINAFDKNINIFSYQNIIFDTYL